MKKIAITTALVIGTATAAFAEDSSSIVQLQHLPAGRRAAAARAPGPQRCADRPSERHRSLADVSTARATPTPAASKLLTSPGTGVPPAPVHPGTAGPPAGCSFVYRRFLQARMDGFGVTQRQTACLGGADLHAAQSDATSSPHCAVISSNAQFERIFFAIFTRARSRSHEASRRSQARSRKS